MKKITKACLCILTATSVVTATAATIIAVRFSKKNLESKKNIETKQ